MRFTPILLIVVVTMINPMTARAASSWTDAGRFEVDVPISGEAGLSTIRGFLSKPQGNGPFAAVVMFPGISGFGVHLGDLTRHADHYNGMGLVALAMDPAGSRGYPAGSSPTGPALRKDAYAALNYLRSTAIVGPQKIFVEGISRGGGVVLAALDANQNADQSQRFAGGIAYVPWCYPSLAPYAPLIIFSAGDDWVASAKPCEQLRGRANLDVVVFPGAAHEFATSGTADARSAQAQVDAFITNIIGGRSPALSTR
jgi:dienelactone hydrolase